jgi:hypothetical protein
VPDDVVAVQIEPNDDPAKDSQPKERNPQIIVHRFRP